MPNAVLTAKNAPGVTSALVVAHLKEKAKFIRSISKESSSVWGEQHKAANPGDTIYIKKPARFTVGSSLDVTSTIQDLKDEKVALTVDKLANVAFEMTSLETAYDKPIKYWNDEFVEPAVNSLAAELEKWALDKAVKNTANLVGTAGTPAGAILGFLQAGQKIYENVCPEGTDLFGMLTPGTNTTTVDARKGLFQSSEQIAKQYKSGYIGMGEGFQYMRSNLLPTITNGNDVTGAAVDDTVATGASVIHIDGITTGSGTVTAGMVFTIDGVFDVHPITKQTLSTLKQFVVITGGTASGTSDIDLTISPTIYGPTSGSLQNVSALPADNAAIVFFGNASTAYAQNLLYHPDAFRFVSVPLYKPDGLDFVSSQNVDGMNIRVLRDFDIKTSKSIMRFDILAGLAAVRPEWACRYTG
jgi:hypothetical protein